MAQDFPDKASAVIEREGAVRGPEDEALREAPACPVCGGPSSACAVESHTFYLENLGCANCAAKMEERIAQLPRVEDANLVFATKQLRVACPHPAQMLPVIQEVCQGVESDVVVRDLGVAAPAGDRAALDEAADANAAPAPAGEAGPFDALVDGVAGGLQRLLPGRAGAWYADLEDEGRRDLASIAVAAVLFILGMVVRLAGAPWPLQALLFLVAYLAVGFDILATAARNIRSGDFFDENLLMSVASLGAFVLGEFPEAVAVMMFYRVGEFFEDRATDRSRDAIMEAVDMRPATVNLLPAFNPAMVDSALTDSAGANPAGADHAGALPGQSMQPQVVPAETARPQDYILVRPGERIPLDSTVVMGQSRLDTSPVTGEPVPVHVEPGSQATSGCVNGEGALVLRVDAPLAESMVTRILDAVQNAAANKPRMERFITRFARVYTPAVIAIAVATAVLGGLATGNWSQWIYTACTFLVISCPCAIVISIPLSFFAGLGAASKLGVLFKGGEAIEALSGVRAVVMDKTGTITQGEFAVQEVMAAEPFAQDELLQVAASAEALSTHPIAASIVQAARMRGLACPPPASVREVAGKGVCAQLGSAGDEAGIQVLCGSASLLQQEGVDLPRGIDDLARHGATSVLVAIDGVLAGAILIADAARDDAAQAIASMREHGLHTTMLTGDALAPAQAMADAVGVDDVRAQLLPQQKVDELARVRAAQGPVMFVGDGINDAPVLAGADVGAAMGSGSDAAIEAADVVVLSSSLGAVVQSIDLAHVVHRIAVQNIVFALGVKLLVMALGFAGMASMWAAVFADVGVAILCIMNAARILRMRFA